MVCLQMEFSCLRYEGQGTETLMKNLLKMQIYCVMCELSIYLHLFTDSFTKEELAKNLNTTFQEILAFEYGRTTFYEEAKALEVHLKIAILMEDLGFLHLE